MTYLISNQHTNKGLDHNIHVINGIYSIKGRSTLHILVAMYTDKYVKGQCIGNMEPSFNHMLQTPVNSITTQKMIDKHVHLDAFTPPLHTLLGNVRKSPNQLLETFKSQFVQDETIHLTKMQNDIGDSECVFQRPYPITMKHYDWVKNEINKLLDVQVICSSHSSYPAPIIVVPKGDG